MVRRVDVTLGIDTLLPFAEAGQCLISMVNYLQALLVGNDRKYYWKDHTALQKCVSDGDCEAG